MNWLSINKKTKEGKIEYSDSWFDQYSKKSLRDLYSDCKSLGANESETFILDLSNRLRAAFSLTYNDIKQSLPDYQFTQKKSVILEEEDHYYYFNLMIAVLRESYTGFITGLLKENKIGESINQLESGIKKLCEDCFSNLINKSLVGLEMVMENKLFQYADVKTLLREIIEETLKPENFNGRFFSMCLGDNQATISKWYEIAIKHNIFKLNDLTQDQKNQLIPYIKSQLASEQNLKLAKGFSYPGIDGLEDFYKLHIERFENEKKERQEQNKEISINDTRSFLAIGTKSDLKVKNARDMIEKKEIIFKNIFVRLKHKFDYRPTAANFESLFNPDVDYCETFNWVGDYSEFIALIKFLKEKEIIRQTNLQNALTSRFLVNGKHLKNKSSISSQISQIKIDPKSEWVKTLESCLY